MPRLTERITATFRKSQQTRARRRCTLLAGHGECRVCAFPLTDEERQRILIQHEREKTTIARVTCPTAPKFWRWRNVPWPKMVQRDVEFFEHAEETDEWKAQLAAALLCGALGLGAYLFRDHPQSMFAYLLAYLAGSWFTVQEVCSALWRDAEARRRTWPSEESTQAETFFQHGDMTVRRWKDIGGQGNSRELAGASTWSQVRSKRGEDR